MKILILSSFYPPHYVGGYELGCREVAEALKQRGHTIRVLTSSYGLPRPASDGEVFRWLRSDLGWSYAGAIGDRFRLLGKEIQNRRALARVLAEFQPDLVYVWPMLSISLSLLFSGSGRAACRSAILCPMIGWRAGKRLTAGCCCRRSGYGARPRQL